MSLVDTGPSRTSSLGLGRSGQESVMAMEGFHRNTVAPPEWECEAMGSVVWVQCTNLCRVYLFKLSIAASSVMGMGSY